MMFMNIIPIFPYRLYIQVALAHKVNRRYEDECKFCKLLVDPKMGNGIMGNRLL